MPAAATGSLRERRAGVWEIRVAAGTDPVTCRTIQRSLTFYGSKDEAEAYRVEVAAEYASRRLVVRAAPMLTVAELLERWLLADHPWRPSTWVGYRSNARALQADTKLAQARVVSLSPAAVRAAMARWTVAGATGPVVGGRFRALRAAIGWAYDERIIDYHPIRNMVGPPRPEPRQPVAPDDIRRLLRLADERGLVAMANDDGSPRSRRCCQDAEQDLLLVRLAADSGARRGELAALQFGDLQGRVLTLARAVSADEVGPTKSGRARHLTLGASTARLWRTLEEDWKSRLPARRTLGPWIFASDPAHDRRLTAGVLDRRFRRLRDDAEVPDATLHKLRHSVATFLVSRGHILKAQARLGHGDASTTLRVYSHAVPLDDVDIADAIDQHLTAAPDVNGVELVQVGR